MSCGYLSAEALTMGMVRPSGLLSPPWTASHSEWTAWAGAFPVQFGLVAQRYVYEVRPRAIDAMAEVAATSRN